MFVSGVFLLLGSVCPQGPPQDPQPCLLPSVGLGQCSPLHRAWKGMGVYREMVLPKGVTAGNWSGLQQPLFETFPPWHLSAAWAVSTLPEHCKVVWLEIPAAPKRGRIYEEPRQFKLPWKLFQNREARFCYTCCLGRVLCVEGRMTGWTCPIAQGVLCVRCVLGPTDSWRPRYLHNIHVFILMSVGGNLCPQCSFHMDMPLLHLINANIFQEEVPDCSPAQKKPRGSPAGNWKTPNLITLYSLQSCAKSAVYAYPHQIHSTFPWGTVKYLPSQVLYCPHCASTAPGPQRQPHDPPQISKLAILTEMALPATNPNTLSWSPSQTAALVSSPNNIITDKILLTTGISYQQSCYL